MMYVHTYIQCAMCINPYSYHYCHFIITLLRLSNIYIYIFIRINSLFQSINFNHAKIYIFARYDLPKYGW